MARNYTDVWRPLSNDVTDFQNEARKRDLFTDIQFVIGKEASSKTFSAHKAILACGSPVFEKMFYGEMAEKRSVINIEDDDPEAFEMLLSCLYGKEKDVQIHTFIRASKCYVIGDKYLVPGIQNIVTAFISSTPMTEDIFWEIIERDVFSWKILVDKLLSFIQDNAYNLMASEKMYNMPEVLISTILQMDELDVLMEYDLLMSVTKWAYNCIGSDTNSKDLIEFLRHIRFSIITVNDFLRFSSVFPSAIDTQSSLDILKHLLDKSTYRLPSWCSKSDAYRSNEIVENNIHNNSEVIHMLKARQNLKYLSDTRLNPET